MDNFNIAKDPISDGVNPVVYPATRQPSVVGNVILSREVTRDEYIENCYRNNVVTIRTNRGEIIKNCFVNKSSWNDIKFPLTNQDTGSTLLCVNVPIFNKCVVVAVISRKDEVLNSMTENASTMGGDSNGGTAKIITDSDLGRVDVFTESSMEGSGFNIKILNEDGMGLFKVYVQGDISLESESQVAVNAKNGIDICISDEEVDDKSTNITAVKGEGIMVSDEFDNLIITDESGILIIDKNNNQLNFDEDGIELLNDFGNKVTMNTDGISQSVKDYTKKILLVSEDNENDATEGTLYKPLEDFLNDVLTDMSSICDVLSTLTVILSTGVINPAVAQQLQQLSTQIRSKQANIQKIKSKTVKLT